MELKELFALESTDPPDESPNVGHCSECNSDWLLSDCNTEIDQETWELPPYTIYICRKCGAELDDFWYEEDEEFL